MYVPFNAFCDALEALNLNPLDNKSTEVVDASSADASSG